MFQIYFQIFDGVMESLFIVDKVCGSHRHKQFTSVSNILYVQFRADCCHGGKGFYATYTFINRKFYFFIDKISSP